MKMCEAFSKLGHSVTLYSSPGTDKDPFEYYNIEHRFKLQYCSRPNYGRLGNLLYARNVCNNLIESDVIYSRYIYPMAILQNTGSKLIYEAHQPPGHLFGKSVEKYTYGKESFEVLVTISNSLKNYYTTEFGYDDTDKIITLHDAADPIDESVEKTSLDRATSLHRLQIGYVGSTSKGKGVGFILTLAKHVKDHQFHIVGGSTKEVESMYGDIPSNVACHGYVPNSETGRYIKSFDILLAPYREKVTPANSDQDLSRYMSPLKIFEYMSSGNPMICSDLPVLREVLTHGENCYLADCGDVHEWEQVIRTLENRNIRVEIGNQAYETFVNHHTWERRAQELLNYL
ncbi:glycosyltransferase family 4 protein [Natrialba chahannaoensis]|uniref:glycosyltransferase family 4 protein n=1 Tax=Natrialba chahannaoensis TaxID=68911 RepID=UPI0023A9A7B6|nr:glycosyltransferase family 4 protein [Natrialba chahannaoensis]